jgi:hypothetical protein
MPRGSKLPALGSRSLRPMGLRHQPYWRLEALGAAVNCRHWITISLLATLLMGCASQSSPCRSIDLQDPESEGAREYCRDLAPLRALEIAVADEAYVLLREVGLAPNATSGVSRALDTPATPAP